MFTLFTPQRFPHACRSRCFACGQASSLGAKLPGITPNAKCKLRLLKLERVKDWLIMEEEFVSNQERLKPQEERNEEERTKVCSNRSKSVHRTCVSFPGPSCHI